MVRTIRITDDKLFRRLWRQKLAAGKDTTLEDVIRWNATDAFICKREHSETPLVDNLQSKVSPQAKK